MSRKAGKVAKAENDVRVTVSPTEHQLTSRYTYTVSSACEQHGCDVLLTINPRSRSRRQRVGIQRKEISDLIASMADGRLGKEIRMMGNLHTKILIVEGEMRYTRDDVLVDTLGWGKPWSRKAIAGLLFSVRAKGLWVIHTTGLEDTHRTIGYLTEWFSKDRHSSLDRRPGPVSMFGTNMDDKEWGTWILQVLPGIGPDLAVKIYDMYGVPWTWNIGPEELMMVDGIGEKRAKQILGAFG